MQTEGVDDTNKGLSQEVSILTHACDKVSDDLENSLEKCEYWESQYIAANEAVSLHTVHDDNYCTAK